MVSHPEFGEISLLTPELMPKYLVAELPSQQNNGAIAFATDGRRSGEGAASGTGIPTWYDATNERWATFYDNTETAA